jgi:hypothetical protein
MTLGELLRARLIPKDEFVGPRDEEEPYDGEGYQETGTLDD